MKPIATDRHFLKASRKLGGAVFFAASLSLATLAAPNTLTSEERAEGWSLLFDGKNLSGYHVYGDADAPLVRWSIEGDALRLDGRAGENDKSKVDIVVSPKPYGDFELSFEWKMSPGGNGGVFYKVIESPKYPKPWHTGLEMQLLDDEGHEEGKVKTHRAGDLYDMVASRSRSTRPAGEWNTSRIVVSGDQIEQWLNGKQTVSITIGSGRWKRSLKRSKYADLPDFVQSEKGHIVLQDHGDLLWFRNLKIKEL